MMNKWLYSGVTLLIVFSLFGCGTTNNITTNEVSEAIETQDESLNTSLEEVSTVFDVEVDSNLLDVELTIPKEFSGEKTQEELDQFCEEQGYKSAKINSDGSVTYVMSKKRHKEVMEELRTEYVNMFNDMVGSED